MAMTTAVLGPQNWVSRQLDAMPVGKVHRKVIVAIGFGLFFDIYEVFLSSAISTGLVADFHIDPTSVQLKLLLASAFIGMFVGAAFLGTLADRIGRRKAFIFNLIWYSVWSLVGAFAPNATFLIIARFLAGVGVGAEYPVADAYLSDVLPKDKRGRLASWAYTLSFVAVPAVGFLALWLNPIHLGGISGWRYLLGLGVIGAIIVVFMRRSLPESPRWLESKGRHEEAKQALQVFADGAGVKLEPEDTTSAGTELVAKEKVDLSLFAKKPFAARLFMMFVFHVFQVYGYYGFGTLAAIVLTTRGYTTTASLLYIALSFLGYPIGAALSVPLMRVIERKFLIIGSLVLVALFGILFATSSIPALIVIFGFLTSAVNNIFSNSYHVYQAEIFPTQVRATAVGWTYSISRISTGSLPFILLPILTAAGAGWMFGVVAVALLIVIAVVAAIGPRTMRRSVETINSDPTSSIATIAADEKAGAPTS